MAERKNYRSGPVVEIKTRQRRRMPDDYVFPELLEDKRDNHFLVAKGVQADAYVAPLAGPYTGENGIHLMVIPDSHPDKDDHRQNIPNITYLAPTDVNMLFQTAADLSVKILNQLPNISHVDMGLQYAGKDENPSKLKQKINTFPNNMHVHVTGYDKKDLREKNWQEIEQDIDLNARTSDRVYHFPEEIIKHEIIDKLTTENESFTQIFEETTDIRGRTRFKMKRGNVGFLHPDLPNILQTMHTKGQELYDELGKCFFSYNKQDNKFVEDANDHGRYKLLSHAEREANLESYISERSWLSDEAQAELRKLGKNAQTAEAVLIRGREKLVDDVSDGKTDYRSDTDDKIIANSFWTNKGFAYAMVWSAQRTTDGRIEWTFGFDPKVFTVEGVPQSSSVMDKIITKEKGAFSKKVLTEIQQREAAVVDGLLSKNLIYPIYQRGTKTPVQI